VYQSAEFLENPRENGLPILKGLNHTGENETAKELTANHSIDTNRDLLIRVIRVIRWLNPLFVIYFTATCAT